jgi:hypothetical protein
MIVLQVSLTFQPAGTMERAPLCLAQPNACLQTGVHPNANRPSRAQKHARWRGLLLDRFRRIVINRGAMLTARTAIDFTAHLAFLACATPLRRVGTATHLQQKKSLLTSSREGPYVLDFLTITVILSRHSAQDPFSALVYIMVVVCGFRAQATQLFGKRMETWMAHLSHLCAKYHKRTVSTGTYETSVLLLEKPSQDPVIRHVRVEFFQYNLYYITPPFEPCSLFHSKVYTM